jgi:hypothetical protein
MNHSDITRLRLRNQQIAAGDSRGRAETAVALVTRMGAFQAQDYSGAKWSLGLRLPGATEADIERAIADRSIVRTWPMRGTLHFVPAADCAWMLALTTPRILAGSVARERAVGLDEAVFARCRAVIQEALQGGRTLTRDALLQAVERSGVPTGRQRGYHLLWRTAQEGLICFAANQGKQPAFALLDEWVPPARRVAFTDRVEALGELARRYFRSHGPATLQDFAWWSGLLAADARAGVEASQHHLEQITAEGRSFWMSPGGPGASGGGAAESPAADGEAEVSLLPGFDEYMLGYRDRSAALDPLHAPRICPGANGVFMPTIVSRGQVVGIWKRTVTKRGVVVTPEPFRPLSDGEEKSLAIAAERYRRFLTPP